VELLRTPVQADSLQGEFAFFTALVLLHFQGSILQLALASHMLHRFSVGSTAVWSVVKLVGYSLFVWFDSLTLERAILVDTIAYALSYVLMRVAYRKQSAGVLVGRELPDAVERKRLLRYGLLNNFNDVGTLMLSSKADLFSSQHLSIPSPSASTPSIRA
jgi:hypothetical protein